MKRQHRKLSAFLMIIFAANFVSGCGTLTCPPASVIFQPSVRDQMTRGSAEQVVIQNAVVK